MSMQKFYYDVIARDCEIIAFYPYTTFVQNAIINCDLGENPEFESFCESIIEKAIKLGARDDNKIAIEIRIPFDSTKNDHNRVSGSVFIGSCDHRYTLGLSIWQPDNYTKKYNLYLHGGKLVENN